MKKIILVVAMFVITSSLTVLAYASKSESKEYGDNIGIINTFMEGNEGWGRATTEFTRDENAKENYKVGAYIEACIGSYDVIDSKAVIDISKADTDRMIIRNATEYHSSHYIDGCKQKGVGMMLRVK